MAIRWLGSALAGCLVTAAVLLGAGEVAKATTQTPLGYDLRADWDVTVAKSGKPVVSGYIHNGRPYGVARMRLLIESLDDSGQVVGKTVGYVDTGMGPFGRTYFETRVDKPGAAYRVVLLNVDWILEGRGRDRRW